MALIASKAIQRRKPPFLPDEILAKLKCNECGDYLSTPPILKHPDGQSICGDCSKYLNDESYIRNTEYEAIASFVEFPCKNRGCHQRILFGKYTDHEYNCPFRQYECPVLSCLGVWQGVVQELGTHFATKHPEFYLNGVSFCPVLTKNCELYFLYVLDNTNMFIVQTKCLVLECKFWCLLRYLGKPKQSGFFGFRLEFRGNRSKKTYFTEETLVQSDLCWIMDNSGALEININNLLKELCCPLELKCRIHIRRLK